MSKQSLCVPQRNVSSEPFEVAGIHKGGTSGVILVFLEHGFQQRFMAILQSCQDTLERPAYAYTSDVPGE